MKRFIYILLTVSAFLYQICLEADAQGKKQKTARVTSTVVDINGTAIGNVLVTANEGRSQVLTAPDGTFRIWTYSNATLLLEKNGYETRTVNVRDWKVGERIILEKAPLYSGQDNSVDLPYGIEATERSVTGSVFSISGDELLSYPDLVLGNSLAGRITGLTVLQQPGEFGRNEPKFYVRGFSTLGNNEALVLVDGLERSMDGMMAEEIESVTVLKDAASKILYGPRAANGVILVKTKRGERYKRTIDVSVEYGVTIPVALPDYLNSADYVRLYNEACLNDGLKPFYSQSMLDGYAASAGPNDLRYPDVDYYDYFLKKTGSYRKVNAAFTGGNEGARYAVSLGYIGGDGIEKIGKTTVTDRFNVRGNLDVRISDAVTAFLDVAGRIEFDNMANFSAADFFGAMSSHRPNEYPLFLEGDLIDNDMYGDMVFGGSFEHPDNLYMSRAHGGNKTDRYFTGQANFGFNFELDRLLKGLDIKLYITMDNYSYLAKGQTLRGVTYAPVWYQDASGNEVLDLVDLTERKYQGDTDITGKLNEYNLGYYANLTYGRKIKDHKFDITLLYAYYTNETPGWAQDIKNMNTVLRAAYEYKDKYYFEATGALMGSGRFSKLHRFNVSPALGAGWVMSEEDWFDAPAVDYLKLRASTGLLGYDANTPFYLYEQRWSNKGDLGFGNPNDEVSIGTVGSASDGNPDLMWEKSFQTNAGLDLLMLDGRFSLTADYFYEYRYNIVQQVWSNFETTAGHMIPYQNWGIVRSQGAELDVTWSEKRGDFRYSVGVGASYATSEILRDDVLPYAPGDEGRSTEGMPADYMMGYLSQGLFPTDFNIASYPRQTFGMYQSGDIRYRDMNGDNVIDDLDMRMVGNSIPRTVLSLDINLNYKGFGLYLLGTANLGYDVLLDNSYYFGNRSTGKYSAAALDRWHPVNNPDGTFPRLTTTDGENNFQTSDFWIADASFFRLKNVELSYTFSNRNLNAVVSKVRVFARGTNLWTVSRIKGLDPEVLDGGVTSYPLMMTVTGGVSVTF